MGIMAAVKNAGGSLKLELERPKRSPLAVQSSAAPAAGASQPAAGDRFTVVINKAEGQTLGVGLHDSGESVAINEIKPDGAVLAHNAANPATKVEISDILKSINGSGSTMADIMAAVKNAGGSLKLELERPKRSL